jgi:hypothetical protein
VRNKLHTNEEREDKGIMRQFYGCAAGVDATV